MTSITPEYRQQVFDYETVGFEAATSGDLDTAITVWTAVLDDERMAACFDDASLREMASNLALAHLANGDTDAGEQVMSVWGLSEGECDEIRENAAQGTEV